MLTLLATATASVAGAELSDLTLDPVLTGQSDLVGIHHGGDSRLFLVYRSGHIRIFDQGVLLGTDFLDISQLISFGEEPGLMGAAWHPNYAINGYFFVYYVDLEGRAVLARYRVGADDPDVADATSGRTLLEIDHNGKHYGGELAFRPGDGYLYLAIGDGGPDEDPNCTAQDTSQLMGKILRLDVDSNTASPPYHAVPADNPFVGVAGADEIWAYGLRNPWRISFDPLRDDLYIADVGQWAREEIDFEPSGSAGGRNYGWRIMEGTFCHDPDPIVATCPMATPSCNDPAYTDPVFNYGRDAGECSIIGGKIYRGQLIGALHGRYLYGDWCSGRIWAIRPPGWTPELLPVNVPFIVTFGTDVDGEILLTDGATLYRLELPGALFFDGFETGDTARWSSSTP